MVKKVIATLLVTAALFGAQTPQADGKAAAKASPKTFEVTSIDGKKFHLTVTQRGVECKECKGKVLLLDFFGKHCPPCRASIPTLAKTQKELKDKLQILSFHVQETLTPQDVMELRKELGINYPIMDMTANPQNYAFIEYIGAASGWQNTIPYMLFFDPSGRYRGHHYGVVDAEGLKKAVEKLYSNAHKEVPKKAKP
jgi:thiol-disulfide isomerase/thioredoxin